MKDGEHRSTTEVQRGVEGAGDEDGGRGTQGPGSAAWRAQTDRRPTRCASGNAVSSGRKVRCFVRGGSSHRRNTDGSWTRHTTTWNGGELAASVPASKPILVLDSTLAVA